MDFNLKEKIKIKQMNYLKNPFNSIKTLKTFYKTFYKLFNKLFNKAQIKSS